MPKVLLKAQGLSVQPAKWDLSLACAVSSGLQRHLTTTKILMLGCKRVEGVKERESEE